MLPLCCRRTGLSVAKPTQPMLVLLLMPSLPLTTQALRRIRCRLLVDSTAAAFSPT
jgi:hypothetical protein